MDSAGYELEFSAPLTESELNDLIEDKIPLETKKKEKRAISLLKNC